MPRYVGGVPAGKPQGKRKAKAPKRHASMNVNRGRAVGKK
jgi:hypothetical protein